MKNKKRRHADLKRALLLALLSITVPSCGGEGSPAARKTNTSTSVPAPTAAASPKAAADASPTLTPAPGIIATLKKSKGKYPYELKLLDNAELKSRLQKLLGVDFASLKANWNVETPIEIENGILMTSGCEKHNCGNNIYYMFVDLERDNINVYHLKNGRQVYTEAARIDLPKRFSDEIEPEE